MALNDDLIVMARRLARANPSRPRQADLRRAVSTACYAVFHALARQCADRFVGTGQNRSHPDSADLIRVGFAARPDRFYRTVIWADLVGGVSLVREYGQLGRPGRMHLDPQGDRPSARKRMARLIRDKERHGYRRIA